MIRFKVFKGSHILLAVSAIALIIVLAIILLSAGNGKYENTPMNQTAASSAITTIADDAVLQVEIIPDIPDEPVQQTTKSIIVYHTHTHEAYEQSNDDPYEAIEAWRTKDQEHSIVRVGAELTKELRNKGYNVIHDTTDHELEDINTAYVRSEETLKSYEEEFDLCIDLHRDAYSKGMLLRLETDVGFNYAQTMVLIGQGSQFPDVEQPNYKQNLAFAHQLTQNMNQSIPGICRNATIKSGRYNQHLGRHSILIEVGHNQNSLQEALATIPYLANAIDTTLSQF